MDGRVLASALQVKLKDTDKALTAPHSLVQILPPRGKMVEISLECAIVGQAGTFDVPIDDGKKLSVLKKAIKKKNPATIPCDIKDLKLFKAKTERGAWLDTAGAAAVKLDGVGHLQGFERMDPVPFHVLVVVPKIEPKHPTEDDRIGEILKRLRTIESDMAATMAILAATKPKTLINFKELSVQEDEFQLDNLTLREQSVEPVVLTPTLHEFWEGFGEFPPALLC
ncbi:unnamed protein product [Phytophthora fragariaefolia]|uniref:Unnamed protein product n=1 Tax=Phytophthora fragariaefolia TaxID=1490495 RepID=A0A9W7CQ51_9STRA|nr:unnamed protein product [Phytophthora fragariaefolia]